MKSRLPTLERRIKEDVSKQLRAERSKIYDDVSADVVRQAVASCAVILEKQYGFDAERLHEFTRSVFAMISCKPFGKDITAVEALAYLKSKYGIDLDSYTIETGDAK